MRLLYIILINLVFSNYSIVQSESKVEYFGSHPTHGFSGISSSILLVSDCSKNGDICDLKFKVPIISLNSGNDNRDSNMLNYLKAFSFPYAELNIFNFSVKEYDSEFISAEMTIGGVEQQISIPITLIKESAEEYKVQSSFTISLKQFGIEIPKLLFLPINSNIKINVSLLINSKAKKSK